METENQSNRLKELLGELSARTVSVTPVRNCKNFPISLVVSISTGFIFGAGFCSAQESTPVKVPAQTPAQAPAAVSKIPTAQEIATLKAQVDESPQDSNAHLAYAHALRLSGKPSAAATEYLEATSLDPSLFVAYHELALSKARPDQLDEAIERLNLLKDNQPKNLMLRIALSEMLEQRGKLYPAAKTLVDLIYANAVPERYLPKVRARIHYLLAKNKDAMAIEKASNDDLENDASPLPLPESSLKRSASTGKMKDAKVMQNFGHSTLLP